MTCNALYRLNEPSFIKDTRLVVSPANLNWKLSRLNVFLLINHLCIKYFRVNGIQMCSNEGPWAVPMGHNSNKVKIYYLLLQTNLVNYNQFVTRLLWVLFVCFGIYVPFENFHLYGEVTIAGKGCKLWPILGTHGHWALLSSLR